MDSLTRQTGWIVVTAAVILTASSAAALELPEIHGFAEADAAVKMDSGNTKHDDYNLLEQRIQLKSTSFFSGDNYLAEKGGIFNFKGDFTVDEYFGGKTGFELRELNLGLTPLDIVDVKAGRQVLTWGTGDYLFINDLFPKDYVSFFAGRDDEYLKKPSDALRVSVYPSWGNLDAVVMAFEPNTTAAGDRLTFFDPLQGGIAGRESERELLEPARQADNLEYALRYYRNIGSHELALYYFRGFDKNPNSFKSIAERQLFYRRLDVYGWSLRGPVAGGIGNAEFGYARSREDSEGTDRLIENSQLKMLAGYSKDLGNDLKIGVQYQFEKRLDYAAYTAALLPGDLLLDEYRHLVTQRITKQFLNQTLTLSLFNFYSPSDKEGYIRPVASYDWTDQWKVTLGVNIPWGDDDYTEFGQMKENKNIYVRVRYSF
ncbi:MAG: hypothetical protein KC897_11610 [Candidatus Omnitrophica bacterium]|nr:hypothetical protein [Candidatus Omnitrophota bacterium]MCB9720037.1 hypothetical protein [Candidatus Omnitrophota bacterium]